MAQPCLRNVIARLEEMAQFRPDGRARLAPAALQRHLGIGSVAAWTRIACEPMFATAAALTASAAALACVRIAQIIDSIAKGPNHPPLLSMIFCIASCASLVYGVHLRLGVLHDATAFIDCLRHRTEQIRLRLNRFAIT